MSRRLVRSRAVAGPRPATAAGTGGPSISGRRRESGVLDSAAGQQCGGTVPFAMLHTTSLLPSGAHGRGVSGRHRDRHAAPADAPDVLDLVPLVRSIVGRVRFPSGTIEREISSRWAWRQLCVPRLATGPTVPPRSRRSPRTASWRDAGLPTQRAPGRAAIPLFGLARWRSRWAISATAGRCSRGDAAVMGPRAAGHAAAGAGQDADRCAPRRLVVCCASVGRGRSVDSRHRHDRRRERYGDQPTAEESQGDPAAPHRTTHERDPGRRRAATVAGVDG